MSGIRHPRWHWCPITIVIASVAASACGANPPTAPTPLTISSHPQSQTVAEGESATLNVSGTGQGPISYRWFVGTSGNTSTPIDGATGATYTTPAMTTTTNYWVRLSDGAATADSNTALIVVARADTRSNPPTAPTLTTQPASQTITSGQTATLSVAADGTTPLSFAWYMGPSGSTSSPVNGATSKTFTTAALTATTSFWVRVSNAAGAVDSATATITVTPPPPAGTAPSIAAQPQSQTINSGQTATLSVGAGGTGPLSYQWYQGSSGATSSPIGGATGTGFTTPALTATTSYWVRVSNASGAVNSNTATVTVIADTSNPSAEDQVLVIVNQRRAAGATCGGTPYPPVGPLRMNANLQLAARLHSQDMATQNYFSHTSLDGRTFDQRIRNAGYNGSFPLGENLAGGQSSPQSLVDGWMSSPGHCANIMNGAYRSTGVGYAFSASSTYRHYWTQTFGGS